MNVNVTVNEFVNNVFAQDVKVLNSMIIAENKAYEKLTRNKNPSLEYDLENLCGRLQDESQRFQTSAISRFHDFMVSIKPFKDQLNGDSRKILLAMVKRVNALKEE